MTDNEIISRWRGECRHELYDIEKRPQGEALICTCGAAYNTEFGNISNMLRDGDHEVDYMEYHMLAWYHSDYKNTDYTTDPSAWTPELFSEIEDKGLMDSFCWELQEITKAVLCPMSDTSIPDVYKIIKSTPAQKSQALARAIMEVSQ